MAKRDDTGVPVKPPTKVRRFPWRLWLYAVLMTGAAGAGGYFAWTYRGKANDAASSETAALDKAAAATKTVADKDKAITDKDAALTAKATEAAACATKRDELDKTNSTLAKDLGAQKDQLAALAKVIEQNKQQLDDAARFKQSFAKMIDSGALKIITRHGNLVLSLPAEVLFASGVADLSEEGKVKVHEIGFSLKDKGMAHARYLVVGHSDSQPLKNSVYKDNWDLSTARALTVTRELVAAGLDPKNLLPAGAGEHDPISPKELAKNRRIEIVLLPAFSELTEDKK